MLKISHRAAHIFMIVSAFMGLLIVVAGCQSPATPEEPQRVLQVVASLGRGGLGDLSFNDAAYAGLQEAQAQYGIRFETVAFLSEDETTKSLRNFARQKYDLIIGIGFENGPVIEAVAAEFPELNFAVIDLSVEGDNIASVTFKEQEGDFVMGVLAAMLSEGSDKVGFIGGPMNPGMARILSGYKQGVAYQNPDMEVLVDLASTFTDPEEGQELALAQYEAGAMVIHNAAGRTGLGIIEAADAVDLLTTGTSGDQRYLAPGNMVGNRPKRTDTAIRLLIESLINDEFEGGIISLGFAEEGLQLGPFDEELVSGEMLAEIDTLRDRIISGEITIEVPE